MHEMKDYNKVIKEIEKNTEFKISKMGRKNTIKITHIPTMNTRTTHPGKNAIHPIRRWLKKLKQE